MFKLTKSKEITQKLLNGKPYKILMFDTFASITKKVKTKIKIKNPIIKY